MSGHRRVPTLTSGVISTASGAGSYIAVFVDDYLSASIEMVSNSANALAVIFEVSNDAVGDPYTGAWDGTSGNWKSLNIQRTNTSTTESTLTINGDLAYGWNASLGWRWLRIRCTSVTSGSTTWYIKPQYEPICYIPAAAATSTTISGGQAAHDAAISGNPVRVSGRARTSNYTAVANDDVADLVTSTVGALIMKSYSIPELDWVYAATANGISNTTTAVTIKPAAGSGIRNYITAIQITSDALGAATEIAVRDGAAGTVLWRQKIGTAGLTGGLSVVFPSPLKSTANTLLEVVTLTASVTGAVYFNAQGYTAP